MKICFWKKKKGEKIKYSTKLYLKKLLNKKNEKEERNLKSLNVI